MSKGRHICPHPTGMSCMCFTPAAALPNLGLATTRELLEELRCRIEIDYYAGGGGLDYSTVNGRPQPSLAEERERRRREREEEHEMDGGLW